MKLEATPTLDTRDAAAVFAALMRLAPAWTPELKPSPKEPAWAIMQIFARYMQSLIERLNQAPDKNLLAFLDALGIGLIPPKPARAPVFFTPVPNAADAIIPARTRLSAKVPGRTAPLIFETERQNAMAAAKLTDVFTVWPTRDAYMDHSTEAAGKRPVTLFAEGRAVPHEFYLAHDTVFAFSGRTAIDIEFELATPGSTPVRSKWEFWDGQVWRPFQDIDSKDPNSGRDGTYGFTRSGILSLRAECGDSKPTAVNGIKAHWIRGRVEGPFPPDPGRALPMLDRVRVRSAVKNTDMGAFPPDGAFADALQLDVSKAFCPFDQQPRTGSAFYLSAEAAFAKPGAQVQIKAENAPTALEASYSVTSSPTLAFEYWDGTAWKDTGVAPATALSFINSGGTLTFTVPRKIAATKINDKEAIWVRIRIASGNFVHVNEVSFTDAGSAQNPKPVNKVNIITVVPPALQNLVVSYTYRSPWMFPEQCFTYSDFQWEYRSRDVRWPGNAFPVFSPVTDATPALYLGFDQPLPNDLLSLYFDIDEATEEGPPLVWEAWDGGKWTEVTVEDETGRLSRPGMVSLIAPLIPARPEAAITEASGNGIEATNALDAALFKRGDQVVLRQGTKSELARVESVNQATISLQWPLANKYTGGAVTLAALPRFGTSRDWIRARMKENGAPHQAVVNGIYANSAWAVQVETVTGEVLGGGLGVPNQSVFFNRTPVLPGEQVEIRELEGARADVEYPALREDLLANGFTESDIRTAVDARTGKVTEVWVLWRGQPHFYFSSADDRHYVVERTRSRLLFGDGRNGKLPPAGQSNIRAREYQAGGGHVGNVPAGALRQIMSGVLASAVSNPRAGEGGADGETPGMLRSRGPHVLRHQERALSALDYEMLAREASPAVAAVRVLPATAPNGRPAPGWVTLIVVPQSQDAQPLPSFELRRQVHDFLALRAPATLAPLHIGVIGPTYLPVGVSAVAVPRDLSMAGTVADAAVQALARFLHPLTGGPDGEGWPFGRGVYASDVAALLENTPGMDHIEFLELRLNDTPVGDYVPVPPDRMVVAGPLRIEVRGS